MGLLPYIETPLLISIMICIGLFIAWAEILFHFAQQDKSIIFGIIFGLGWFAIIARSIFAFAISMTAWNFFWLLLIASFLVYLGVTLYEEAGTKKRRWYYLTLIIPILAFVYQFVKKQ